LFKPLDPERQLLEIFLHDIVSEQFVSWLVERFLVRATSLISFHEEVLANILGAA